MQYSYVWRQKPYFMWVLEFVLMNIRSKIAADKISRYFEQFVQLGFGYILIAKSFAAQMTPFRFSTLSASPIMCTFFDDLSCTNEAPAL